ncbi:MAG TPA: hypothetical protein VGM05_32315 [Planctomycetaceae bacterium]|jgi:flagellar motility protein MotE (MotC chaperone)
MRYLLVIIGCVCTTIVVAETTGVIMLWKRGMISRHHLREIRLVLTNRALDEVREEASTQKPQFPSAREVAQARAVKVLNLDKREGELTSLKGMAESKREDLEQQQKHIQAEKLKFREELARIDAELTSASTEQARGVLLALPPKDAVQQLLQLPLDQDVVLMKGMPEKIIAKILKEFQTSSSSGTDENGARRDSPAQRGRLIFEALSRGEPSRSVLDRQGKNPGEGETGN